MKLWMMASCNFELQRLAPGVYAAIAIEGGWAASNAGIVDLGDETVVFDTFISRKAALELKEAAVRLTGKPARYVINSHWHVDHVKGNEAFPEAEIVSTTKTAEVMAKMKKRYETKAESIRKKVERDLESVLAGPADQDRLVNEGYDRGLLQDLGTFRHTVPSITFEDRMILDGTERRAEAITYGGGHTVSDLLLYLPRERIVFAGGLVYIGYQPYLLDGNPEELLRILDKIGALDVKTVVPAHGHVGTRRDISRVKDYVLALQRTAEEVRVSGGDLREATAKPVPSPFNTWKWRSFYKGNLEFLLRNSKRS